jgi:alanine-glyoxylate transaminase / serine-glyoxylate transaminase / serine-pyruvate transaminase
MSTITTTVNPPKRLLMGPGPSPVDPRVYAAMGQPIVGHLDPYFFEVSEGIRAGLQKLFGTKNEFTIVISATGSAGMEACVANFVEPGAKVLVFSNGFFCDRISEMARRNGANVVKFEKAWGTTWTDEEAREVILREKPAVVAYVTAETSTGVANSGKALCAAAHEVGALVIGDCVTSLGTMPINIDDTGIDAAFSCSQKGLGAPPGLSPITVSPRAMDWLRARKTPIAHWYLDLKLIDEYYGAQRRYHHTAPVTMFYAVREALAIVEEEGTTARFARHVENRNAFIAGIEAMGLKMLVEDGKRLPALQTPVLPEGITDAAIRKHLMEGDGIEILGGFGQLAGKILRIGIMGYGSRRENVLLLLDRLEKAFKAEGFAVKGGAVAAAEAVYAAAPAR